MINLLKFIIRYQTIILFVALEIICALLISQCSNYQRTQTAITVTETKGFVYRQLSAIKNYFMLKDDNRKLIAENLSLRKKLENYTNVDIIEKNAVTDTTKYKRLLYKYTTGRVISNSVNKSRNFLVLNVGSNDGIRPEMGVITAEGMVGMITKVSKNYSMAISVLNTDFNQFACSIKRLNESGTITWNGRNFDEVQILDMLQQVNVQVGDTITTGVQSTIFPDNIPIGIVSSFEPLDGSFYKINVKLIQNFKKITDVYVVEIQDKDEIKNLIDNE